MQPHPFLAICLQGQSRMARLLRHLAVLSLWMVAALPAAEPARYGLYTKATRTAADRTATVEARYTAWQEALTQVPTDPLDRTKRDEEFRPQAEKALAELAPQMDQLHRAKVLSEAEGMEKDENSTPRQRQAAWKAVQAVWDVGDDKLTVDERAQIEALEPAMQRRGLPLTKRKELRKELEEEDKIRERIQEGEALHQRYARQELKPTWASQTGTDDYGVWADLRMEGVSQRMRLIAPGRFQMDSPGTPHTVRLTSGYWLAETECTQVLWQAVMGTNPSQFQGDGNRPVEQVSWDDCQKFLQRVAQKQSGITIRLPTEAEWEYACRSGTTTPYAGKLDALGWYSENSDGKTHAVGSKRSNAWGLYDMHGNVWEWCADWYDCYPTGWVSDPLGPAAGWRRVYRGGGWDSYAWYWHSANRLWNVPGFRNDNLGFRFCAQSTSPGGGAP